MTFDENDAQAKYVNSKIKAGARVGWGPFSAGGSYSRGHEKSDQHAHWEGGKVEIPGLQLIGFVNNVFPKSPNPNPEIKPEEFVGGAQK